MGVRVPPVRPVDDGVCPAAAAAGRHCLPLCPAAAAGGDQLDNSFHLLAINYFTGRPELFTRRVRTECFGRQRIHAHFRKQLRLEFLLFVFFLLHLWSAYAVADAFAVLLCDACFPTCPIGGWRKIYEHHDLGTWHWQSSVSKAHRPTFVGCGYLGWVRNVGVLKGWNNKVTYYYHGYIHKIQYDVINNCTNNGDTGRFSYWFPTFLLELCVENLNIC